MFLKEKKTAILQFTCSVMLHFIHFPLKRGPGQSISFLRQPLSCRNFEVESFVEVMSLKISLKLKNKKYVLKF